MTDPDLHTWGEDTLAIVRDAEIDAEDETPEFCDEWGVRGTRCMKTAGHFNDCEFAPDDCPEWGDAHRYEEQETWDHHIVIGCQCGHQPPPEREEL